MPVLPLFCDISTLAGTNGFDFGTSRSFNSELEACLDEEAVDAATDGFGFSMLFVFVAAVSVDLSLLS